jgi:hypothetical protein
MLALLYGFTELDNKLRINVLHIVFSITNLVCSNFLFVFQPRSANGLRRSMMKTFLHSQFPR